MLFRLLKPPDITRNSVTKKKYYCEKNTHTRTQNRHRRHRRSGAHTKLALAVNIVCHTCVAQRVQSPAMIMFSLFLVSILVRLFFFPFKIIHNAIASQSTFRVSVTPCAYKSALYACARMCRGMCGSVECMHACDACRHTAFRRTGGANDSRWWSWWWFIKEVVTTCSRSETNTDREKERESVKLRAAIIRFIYSLLSSRAPAPSLVFVYCNSVPAVWVWFGFFFFFFRLVCMCTFKLISLSRTPNVVPRKSFRMHIQNRQ